MIQSVNSADKIKKPQELPRGKTSGFIFQA